MPFTQGVLTSMSFNTETADFSAEFTWDGKAGRSVAYLSQDYWYTNAPAVSFLVNDTTSIDPASVEYTYTNNYYSFDLSKNDTLKAGDKITLKAVNQSSAASNGTCKAEGEECVNEMSESGGTDPCCEGFYCNRWSYNCVAA